MGWRLEGVEERPRLGPEETRVWRGFTDLHRQRGVGMAAEPLKFSDMESYLNLRQVRHPDQREDWMEIWLALDTVALTWKDGQDDDDGSDQPAASDR